MKEKGFTLTLVLIMVILVLTGVGVIAYLQLPSTSLPKPRLTTQATSSPETASPVPTNENDNWQLPVDLVKCKDGERRILPHGLGSRTIEVKGLRRDSCILEYTNEIEGGHTVYECIIPSSLGEVSLSSLDVSKFCKETRSGSIWQR